mgnify:CR=1 FL=1
MRAGAVVDLKVRPAVVLPTLVIALLSGALNAVAVTGQFTGLLMLPMTLAWHPRHSADPAHAWLRNCVQEVLKAPQRTPPAAAMKHAARPVS